MVEGEIGVSEKKTFKWSSGFWESPGSELAKKKNDRGINVSGKKTTIGITWTMDSLGSPGWEFEKNDLRVVWCGWVGPPLDGVEWLESTLGHFFYHYTTGYLKTHYVISRKNNTTGYLKTHYVVIRKNNIISTLYKIPFLYHYTTGYLKTNCVKLPFNGLIIHLKNNIISGLY